MAIPISESRIRAGLAADIIRIGADPNEMENVVCFVGDDGYWFYFRNGEGASDGRTPEEYEKQTPVDEVVRLLYRTLLAFFEDTGFEDELAYYDAVLSERGIKD